MDVESSKTLNTENEPPTPDLRNTQGQGDPDPPHSTDPETGVYTYSFPFLVHRSLVPTRDIHDAPTST